MISQDKYRFDLVFSYWIFTWYLFYIFRLIKASPKLALTFGLIAVIIKIFLMILYKYNIIPFEYSTISRYTIFKSITIIAIINIVIKVIPLYTLRNEKISYMKDFVILMKVLAVYILYCVYMVGYREIFKVFTLTPMIDLMSKLYFYVYV